MHTIGLDVGGTSIKAGLVDSSGQILRSASRATNTEDLGQLVDSLRNLVEELRKDAAILGIGVGLPGLRSSQTGRIAVSPNIPCLKGADVASLLGPSVGVEVVTRNDADMSAWAEFTVGAAVGTSHLVCLTLGTGVGSGLILDGKLYNGSRGYASEAGHLVVDPEGLPCSCGGRGCLEAMASATGIVALARSWIEPGERKQIPEPWTAEGLARAGEAGHAGARRVFDHAGRYLGIACASLINLLNPDAIVLAGAVMGAGNLLLKPAVAEARRRAFEVGFSTCRIVPARLGPDAGVVGAALFARQVARS